MGGGSADRRGQVGGEWSASRPGCLNSKEIPPSPSVLWEAGWVPQLARTQRPGCEIPSYAGSRILFVQHSASYRSNGSYPGALPYIRQNNVKNRNWNWMWQRSFIGIRYQGDVFCNKFSGITAVFSALPVQLLCCCDGWFRSLTLMTLCTSEGKADTEAREALRFYPFEV